jgi:hypothetical protein
MWTILSRKSQKGLAKASPAGSSEPSGNKLNEQAK